MNCVATHPPFDRLRVNGKTPISNSQIISKIRNPSPPPSPLRGEGKGEGRYNVKEA